MKARAWAGKIDIFPCTPLTGQLEIKNGDLADSAGSDIVVITVGVLPDKNGTRTEVLESNINIYRELVPALAALSPQATFIIVTNPVDMMAYAAWKLSGLPAAQIIGTGTLLDSLRLRAVLSRELGLDPQDIEAPVLGEHGETMVPVWSQVRVGSLPLSTYLRQKSFSLEPEKITGIEKEVREAGFAIRKNNEHSCYGIALSATTIIEQLVGRCPQKIYAATLLSGQYGLDNVYLSLPCRLSLGGPLQREEMELTEGERERLLRSARAIESYTKEVDRILA